MNSMLTVIAIICSMINVFAHCETEYDVRIDVDFAFDRLVGKVYNTRPSLLNFPGFPNGPTFLVSLHCNSGYHCYYPTNISDVYFKQLNVTGDFTTRRTYKAYPNGYACGEFLVPCFKGGELFMSGGCRAIPTGRYFGYFIMRKPFGERGVFFSETFSLTLLDQNVSNVTYPATPDSEICIRIWLEQYLWRFISFYIRPGDTVQHFSDDNVHGFIDFNTFPMLVLPLKFLLNLM